MAGTNDHAKSIMDAIYKRRAVRTYRPDKIEHHPNPLADPSFNIFYDAGTLIVICAKPTGPFAVASGDRSG